MTTDTNSTQNNDKTVELFPIEETGFLKQKLYAIVDSKGMNILPPFIAQNDSEAIRNFTSVLNYSNSQFCRFPKDFSLYFISDYITSFTGDSKDAYTHLFNHLSNANYSFICSGEDVIQPDTDKYNELYKKIESALAQLSNSNNVLETTIGNVPKLSEKISHLELLYNNSSERIKNLELSVDIKPSKHETSFFKKIFN